MAEPLPKQVLDSAVNPTEIVQQTFELERRGFDQRQVQAYLRAVADSLRDAQQREAEIRSRLGKAIRRAETAEQSLRDAPATDPSELTRQIGDEVTTVLDAARAAGEQRVAAAEKSAERLMASAKTEATQIRGAAETIMDERRAEADQAAVEIVSSGKAEADEMRATAEADADATRLAAAERVAHVRDECDALIAEAEEARAQILEDMERRRREARAQVERLRVGRDRLLRSYEVVRRTLEETTVELKLSLKEAKVRGDTAAWVVAGEPLANRQQLEAELADAKLIGRIRTSDPARDAKMLRSPALPRPIDPPQVPNIDMRAETAPTPRKPRIAEAKKTGLAAPPVPPSVAPTLKSTPADATDETQKAVTSPPGTTDEVLEVWIADETTPSGQTHTASSEAGGEEIDAELAKLEDNNLDVVDPADEIEEVIALPDDKVTKKKSTRAKASKTTAAKTAASKKKSTSAKTSKTVASKKKSTRAKASKTTAPKETPSLFAALREQRSSDEAAPATEPAADEPSAGEVETSDHDGIEAQRDVVITDAAKQIEKRLKRALADEQNELLAGIRSAKKNHVVLADVVGDIDTHVQRYVVAINEVAVLAYGAGAALIDAQASPGQLPAGAVEELVNVDVVGPIRDRLESLDNEEVAGADDYVDPVRAFYRQRKTDHLGHAATRLAQLLCVAGVCDALPADESLPWASPAE